VRVHTLPQPLQRSSKRSRPHPAAPPGCQGRAAPQPWLLGRHLQWVGGERSSS